MERVTTGWRRSTHLSSGAQEQLIQAELTDYAASLEKSRNESLFPLQTTRLLQRIHGNLFDDRLNATLLRTECGLLNHNVSSSFKRAVGLDIRSYIEARGMEAAKRLLRHGGLSVMQIAWSVGYSYVESFERAFRRHVGLAPGEFRRVMGTWPKTDSDQEL